jgi:hypothetical protein
VSCELIASWLGFLIATVEGDHLTVVRSPLLPEDHPRYKPVTDRVKGLQPKSKHYVSEHEFVFMGRAECRLYDLADTQPGGMLV